MSEPGTPQAPRRAALTFIFVTVVLDMLALGMVVPVLPHLIEDFLGGDIPRAAQLVGLFSTVWAVMQFFSMPVMGALSDRFGRRPVKHSSAHVHAEVRTGNVGTRRRSDRNEQPAGLRRDIPLRCEHAVAPQWPVDRH
mgnify:CR=1 FL=1